MRAAQRLMLVYMFRRNADRALTTDVTARNLPSRTAACPWVFVMALHFNKDRPPRCITDFEDALRNLDRFGFLILVPCSASRGCVSNF